MTEQEKETVLDEIVDQETVESQETTKNQPQEEVVEQKTTTINEDGTIKVDLRNLNKQQEVVDTKEVETIDQPEDNVVEQFPQQEEQQQILEEVTEDEVEEQTAELAEEIQEAIAEKEESGVQLPENIQKVVDFINETGGSLEDYVRLNQDYSQLNETQLLREYYENTKPHLDKEDIEILMEDFSFDESLDDEKDIRKAKIAFKEEVAKAKGHLEGLKSKYYEQIKAGSRLTPDQQKAVEFFNRYNKENEETSNIVKKQSQIFLNKTNKVFNDKFKGFEYNVGEKRFRFNVKNANEVKQSQSDINNFVKRFLAEDNTIGDAKGYHKALFTAMNADAIANHFYEQGKSDGIKDSFSRSKNVDMSPRGVHEKTTNVDGVKFRVVSGDDSSSLRIKMKK
jgi:hypothetical protein